jgi:hypothetical protein
MPIIPVKMSFSLLEVNYQYNRDSYVHCADQWDICETHTCHMESPTYTAEREKCNNFGGVDAEICDARHL